MKWGAVEQLQRLNHKPERLMEVVYGAICDAVVQKVIPPGTPVSDAGIARQLGVSKTPVREALVRLEAVGLLERRGSRGLCVISPSTAAIRNAYETRAVLEAAISELAAERATAAERAEIMDTAAASRREAEAARLDEFRKLDRKFHGLIGEAAANPILAQLTGNARTLTSVLRARDLPAVGDSVHCGHQHEHIAKAVAAGESEQAGALMREHVLDVSRIILASGDGDAINRRQAGMPSPTP